jgi:DNA-directed RNA polymerase subunit RPC12/RpoP
MKMFNEEDNDNKLLIKCDSPVFADEVMNLLAENKIASRQHDENNDPAVGAYGALTGTAVYVYSKDYERAKEIIAPLIKERDKQKPWCPACGSDDVVKAVSKAPAYKSWSIWVGLVCLLFSLVCAYLKLCHDFQFGHVMDTLILVSTTIAILVFCDYFGLTTKSNYHCKKCGKDFYHRD